MPTVSKNIVWSFWSAAMQIYTGGIIFMLMAKMMPIDDFGLLSFGFSFGTLLATCLDFGQSLMIMKDYPQKKFHSSSYIFNSMIQKVLFIILFGAGFYFYLILNYSADWADIGFRFVVFAILSAYALYFQALLRVNNKFKRAAFSFVCYAFLITLVVIAFYFDLLNLIQFVTYMIFAKLFQLAITFLMCLKFVKGGLLDVKIQKYLLLNSWSFGAHYIFGTFYFTIDTQIIALILEARDVALYQSVFRILYIFLIVSDVTSSVLLPYLSSKLAHELKIEKLSNDILYFLLIIGCALFLVFLSFYQEIIMMLYTEEYIDAYALVLPLSLVILLRTIAAMYGSLLTISNHQIRRVKVVFSTMVVSVLLNVWLIPVFGIIAAAWVSVIVHFILFFGYYLFTKKEFNGLNLFNKGNAYVVVLTFASFWLTNFLTETSFIYRLLLLVLWSCAILILLKKNDNWATLISIMKDKGVM